MLRLVGDLLVEPLVLLQIDVQLKLQPLLLLILLLCPVHVIQSCADLLELCLLLSMSVDVSRSLHLEHPKHYNVPLIIDTELVEHTVAMYSARPSMLCIQ